MSQEQLSPACQCGCGQPVKPGKRFRQGHWAKTRSRRECCGDGCTEPEHARGLCQRHYDIWRSGRANDAFSRCSESGCDFPAIKRGFCQKHYAVWYRQTYPERVAASEAKGRERKRAYHRAYYLANIDKFREQHAARYERLKREDLPKLREEQRRSWAKHKYGLTLEEYRAILARGCAICGMKEDENRRGRQGSKLCMDHDHANGQVRDALCTGCNFAIGAMDDNPDRLIAAAEYLQKHGKGGGAQ